MSLAIASARTCFVNTTCKEHHHGIQDQEEMSDGTDAATSLCEAIVQGSFPQSEQLLTSELTSATITTLLSQISQSRQVLSDEIQTNSKDEAGSVDQWIAQAKKVQEDIARCKLESKRIVEEHEQLQALRDQATDYQHKVDLLETEIEFTDGLTQELQSLSLATQSLKEVEECLANNDPCRGALKIQELDAISIARSKSRTDNIVRDLKDELRLKARLQLEAKLNAQILVRKEQHRGTLEVLSSELDQSTLNSDAILDALNSLGVGHDPIETLMDKLRSFLLQPLRRSARLKLSTFNVELDTLSVVLGSTIPSIDVVLDFVFALLDFFHASFSKSIQSAIAQALLPELMDVLVTDWLTPELPIDLGLLDGLDKLEQRVTVILEKLKSSQWEGQRQLQEWLDDVQRAWLNKRKAATLDAVRKAFASARGSLRQVERVERQVVPTAIQGHKSSEAESDDWDRNWDDKNKGRHAFEAAAGVDTSDEDDTDGWGFDDAEETIATTEAPNGKPADVEDEDTGDAWGWGDESPTAKQKMEMALKNEPKAPNGARRSQETRQEVTLTELYSISEIPDHLIEVIGRDLSDSQTIQATQHKSFDSGSAAKSLLALPTLALAMFRATAPSYYGASPSLTDIHRYNDSLYIAERLRDLSIPSGMPSLSGDIKAMEKFAKMAYSKEMETQRIIVWDLLEGAQGFTSCTQFPYSQEIENAVSSVVDRIRTLHAQWKPILSTSALMQSLGSLVTMVVSKLIASIEEMDDISEPESQRLTAFCQQIATLEDLFLRTPPTGSSTHEAHAGDAISMTAVYVPTWLRFQYLINILESSLVDIKYLWTEGELSLEFRCR